MLKAITHARVLNTHQIPMPINDGDFTTLNPPYTACESLVNASQNYLGNHLSDNYKETLAAMVRRHRGLSSLMSLKLPIFHSQLNFSDKLGDSSDDHGDRLQQDIAIMTTR